MVNVGTVLGPPSPPAVQAGGGQARRRLLVMGRDGAAGVVRGGGSRPHAPAGAGGGGGRARGGSESAGGELACQEDVGEYRRAVAHGGTGRGAGTGDPDQAASMGNRRAGTSALRPLQPRL